MLLTHTLLLADCLLRVACCRFSPTLSSTLARHQALLTSSCHSCCQLDSTTSCCRVLLAPGSITVITSWQDSSHNQLQLWFPGCHCLPSTQDAQDQALGTSQASTALWMFCKAVAATNSRHAATALAKFKAAAALQVAAATAGRVEAELQHHIQVTARVKAA